MEIAVDHRLRSFVQPQDDVGQPRPQPLGDPQHVVRQCASMAGDEPLHPLVEPNLSSLRVELLAREPLGA